MNEFFRIRHSYYSQIIQRTPQNVDLRRIDNEF